MQWGGPFGVAVILLTAYLFGMTSGVAVMMVARHRLAEESEPEPEAAGEDPPPARVARHSLEDTPTGRVVYPRPPAPGVPMVSIPERGNR